MYTVICQVRGVRREREREGGKGRERENCYSTIVELVYTIKSINRFCRSSFFLLGSSFTRKYFHMPHHCCDCSVNPTHLLH